MTKVPSLTFNQLINALRRDGWVVVRQKGSHARWQHIGGRAPPIPIPGNAEIGGWLLKEILSQLGITEEEFNELR